MRKQLPRSSLTHNLNDRSGDDAVTGATTTAIVLVGENFGGASVLEDNAVTGATTSAIVLVGGNRGRKNNAVEGIHVCWLCLCSCCDAN